MTAVGLAMVTGGILITWAGLTGGSIGGTLKAIIRGEKIAAPSTPSTRGESGFAPGSGQAGGGAGGGGGGSW